MKFKLNFKVINHYKIIFSPFCKMGSLIVLVVFFSCKETVSDSNPINNLEVSRLSVSDYINQDSTSTIIFNTLEKFLSIKNQDSRSSQFWSLSDFEQYIFPYNDIVNIEISKDGEYLYLPKVIEVIQIDDSNEYIVKIAFLKNANNDLGIKGIYNLIFDLDELRFKRILNYNTRDWKKYTVGDIEYISSPLRQFNKEEASECNNFNNEIAQLFEMEPKPVKYFSCVNPVELFQIKGFDYIHNMYLSDKGGLSEVTSNIIFSGNNSDTYNHEIVHFYTYEKYYSTIGNLSLINEGLATFFGGSGVDPYLELREKLKLFLKNESIEINQYLYPYSNDEIRNEIAYTVGAILCERALRIHGKDSFLDIFYAKNLQEVLRYLDIEEANLVEELKAELNNEPTLVF